MKRTLFDKSALFLVAIAVVVLAIFFYFFLSLRTDAVAEAMKSDRIINIAFIIERDGKPVSTELFLFYPSNGRGAFLDIPGETGLIIKSLNRVDRIDAVYRSGDVRPFLGEVSRLVGLELPYYLVCQDSEFRKLVDLLSGFNIFVPNPVDEGSGADRILLPSGAITMDGDKMATYATMSLPDEPETDRIERKQKTLQSMLRKIGELKEYVARDDVFPVLYRRFSTNIDPVSLMRLFAEFSRLDVDRIVMQRTTGVYRNVDGRLLLDPHYDGELVKDLAKQTLNALVNAESFSVEDKVFTIEILNGTTSRGLAKKTADIFQSFGYEVVSVENAERQDYASTVLYDRFKNGEAAKTIAGVIRCNSIVEGDFTEKAESIADFQILLGKDFNGRYCLY